MFCASMNIYDPIVHSQYPEAAPLLAITTGTTLSICLIYLVHISGVTWAQNCFIP